MAHFLQQFEVLHITRADLDHIDLVKVFQLGKVHDFRHDRQSGGLLCLNQQADALRAESLEGIRRGARFESAAAQHTGARFCHGIRHIADLLLCLNRAGARNAQEIAAADFGIAHFNHGIIRMEFAVCIFIGFLNPLHIFHDIECLDHINIQARRITDQTKNRLE